MGLDCIRGFRIRRALVLFGFIEARKFLLGRACELDDLFDRGADGIDAPLCGTLHHSFDVHAELLEILGRVRREDFGQIVLEIVGRRRWVRRAEHRDLQGGTEGLHGLQSGHPEFLELGGQFGELARHVTKLEPTQFACRHQLRQGRLDILGCHLEVAGERKGGFGRITERRTGGSRDPPDGGQQPVD